MSVLKVYSHDSQKYICFAEDTAETNLTLLNERFCQAGIFLKDVI